MAVNIGYHEEAQAAPAAALFFRETARTATAFTFYLYLRCIDNEGSALKLPPGDGVPRTPVAKFPYPRRGYGNLEIGESEGIAPTANPPEAHIKGNAAAVFIEIFLLTNPEKSCIISSILQKGR